MTRSLAGSALLVAVALAGCGEKTLDTGAAEKAISDNIAKQIGDKPRRVVCPDSIAAHKGGTFTCRVTRSDGKLVVVKAVQQDDKGDFLFSPTSQPAKP
jgi:Domain of unknown function (DUF4333)